MKCGSMGRIYFLGSSACIVWRNFEGVEPQGWRSIWRGNVEIFLGAINALRTYVTISYVSSKGSESGRRPKRKKGFIECKARYLYPIMKMRNYRRR
jgi:hypothetical protein